MTAPTHTVTEMLAAWSDGGNRDALDQLIPIVYDELHRQAARHLRHERREHTLQTTALVNEAYVRLIDQQGVHWQNRAHFFAIAAEIMRRILVDHARRRGAEKRGGDMVRVTLDEAANVAGDISVGQDVDLIAVDTALTKLANLDEQQAKIVELRFFGGLNVDEAAAVLGISERTVKRDWAIAKAWIRRELRVP